MILNCNCTRDINLTKLYFGLKKEQKIAEKKCNIFKGKECHNIDKQA